MNKSFFITEPIFDTWEIRDDTAVWYINLPLDFTSLSSREINSWYEKTLRETLSSFSDLVRVWKVSFWAKSKKSTERREIEWKSEISYEQYCESFLKSVKSFPFAISSLEIQVDFYVFVRTSESPYKAIRAWVRYLGKFSLSGRENYSKPFIYLDLRSTLFSPFSIDDQDNSELYSLNHPLLENALRDWEQKVGKIDEVEGIEGIYEYGFLPED